MSAKLGPNFEVQTMMIALISMFITLECHLWGKIFYYLIWKSFQNDAEWHLFYCDSTLGCRVIQDFDLCKLDDLWHHNVDTKWCKITQFNLSHNFFYIELKLSTVVTLVTKFHHMPTVTYPWQHNGLQTLSIQRGKSEFSFFKKYYLLLLFIQWVWANIDITQHKHKKVC